MRAVVGRGGRGEREGGLSHGVGAPRVRPPGRLLRLALGTAFTPFDPQIDAAQFGGVVLDVVGTGADMSHTFNVSTARFRGRGGRRGGRQTWQPAITSKCGSADVLTALGAKIELSPELARHCLVTAA